MSFTGSCSNDDKAVIEPAPEFELVTEISETEPLFIVPDQTFKLEYTAKTSSLSLPIRCQKDGLRR